MHNRRCAPPVRPLPARSSSCALACWSDTWWRLCGSRRILAAPTSSIYSCARRAERNAQRVGRTQRRARAVGFKVDSHPSGGVEPCPGRFRRRTNPDRPPRCAHGGLQAISGLWWIFSGRHYQPKWRPVRPPAIVAPLRRVRGAIFGALGRRTKVPPPRFEPLHLPRHPTLPPAHVLTPCAACLQVGAVAAAASITAATAADVAAAAQAVPAEIRPEEQPRAQVSLGIGPASKGRERSGEVRVSQQVIQYARGALSGSTRATVRCPHAAVSVPATLSAHGRGGLWAVSEARRAG